ncbi:50S ribosomal protein L15 [Cerasicoccus arenae]|uniref:Large ribosomal subunit protein uL15 n=1 Tax=Cerasicoccus arenae TaxID=424488 RepID=A0A8J3DLU5_9BACT|nr:50S ribosomal protein L15 [Cerasicoccus arenae]MBK1857348.1 50S ribosomal protein L15 [Cerasicoccus arenae]GHC08911.1 50S ribosomal protein L15 [Cerasicoccus arenae]
MKLHTLKNVPGARSRRKRVGIGEGSGRGKTSTHGQKGQKARSGGSIRIGFESGHIPLYRRLPQRGFNNYRFRNDYAIVNLGDLERVEGDVVDRDVLVNSGLVRSSAKQIKVLGDGDLTRALTVSADKFSGSAQSKIEAAGGKIIVVGESAEKAPESAE